jgi:hypothetical protein
VPTEILPAMTERMLQDAVVELALTLKWRTYHTYDSRRSNPGWPDLILVRRNRIVAIELKSAKGRVSVEQLAWFGALEAAGVECHVYRPSEWCDGTIEGVLR